MTNPGQRKFYVVTKGARPGVYDSWEKCAPNIIDFKKCIYNSYRSKTEAVNAYNDYNRSQGPKKNEETATIISDEEEESIYQGEKDSVQGADRVGSDMVKCEACVKVPNGVLMGFVVGFAMGAAIFSCMNILG